MSGSIQSINTADIGTDGSGGGAGQSVAESYDNGNFALLPGGVFTAQVQGGNGGPDNGDGGSALLEIDAGNIGVLGAPYDGLIGDGAFAEGGSGGGSGVGGSATSDVTGMVFDTTGRTSLTVTAEGGSGARGGNAVASLDGVTGIVSYSASDTSRTDFAGVVEATAGAGGDALGTMTGNNFIAANVTALMTAQIGATTSGGTAELTCTDNAFTVGPATPSAPDDLDLSFVVNVARAGNQTLLNGAPGGNLVFSGNQLHGDGASTLNLESFDAGDDTAASAITIDTAGNLFSIAGSPGNSMTGFTTFDVTGNIDFVLGAGAYALVPQIDGNVFVTDTAIVTPQSGTLTYHLFNFGYGSIFGPLIQTDLEFKGFAGLTTADVLAATSTADGSTLVHVGGSSIELLDYTGPLAPYVEIACFAEATRIATPGGPVAVERLAVGDRVLTADGAARRVRWLGSRRVECRRHPRPQRVWPVRVAAHAFGPGRPGRDLWLSPDHAVWHEGALVPAHRLIDGAAIAQVACDAVTYWHVELDRHDLLLAEGLACESFLDTGQREAFANGGPVAALHPDFAQRLWDADACAPLHLARRRAA